MIVDDEPLERKVLTMIIKKEQFGISQLFEAKNGFDAIGLAKEKQMDIVLMDIKMPVMDGLKAAELIKRDVPDCRIIFLTAHDESNFVHQTIKMGANDYLLKPAHPNEIKQTLIKYIPMVNQPKKETFTYSENENIIKIIKYIKNNLHSDLHLDTLSDFVYLNGQYLCRLFKKETGYTISQYITACRMEKAKHYLSYSQNNVMEISERCGFSDANYFARVFKKYEGITPSQYQQQSLMARKKRINTFGNFVM
ncbi:response regulator [Bacillus sp. CECT 9360]|uniref:response regulator transcription factor n=1 Tax=Bacillus sp. CECT 9360 TaxID=2845821 RepID=UPI001E38D994|nr:response regulator [Bacillus sp. CECT 9360]